MINYVLLGFSSIAIVVFWRMLYPKPYPGIPHVASSVKRISGDIPDLMSTVQLTDEITNSMFAVSTQKLGIPIAQVLFPRFRRPLIVLEDPFEVEDIIVRRHKEFDKAPTAVDIFKPMFARATLSQYTTPELKAQKRLWADVMHIDFLRKAAAPNIHKVTLELLDLWRLKASTLHCDQPFDIQDDLKNATLDAIWFALIGEDAGATRFELQKLRAHIGGTKLLDGQEPRGSFVKAEVAYISNAIFRNSRSLMPTWSQKLEMYTPRHRKFRRTVSGEIIQAMKKAVDRYKHLEMGTLEADDSDTCMMDLVLRRQLLESKKAGSTPKDPAKDEALLDEMFVMLVGGHDSTANALAWFFKFMGAYPVVQNELRIALNSGFLGSKLPSATKIVDTNIPYLDATCEESFRLAGTAKGSVRHALVNTEILGYKIPKGAEVLLNYHINHAPLPVDDSMRSLSSQHARSKHGDCLLGEAGRDLTVFEPRRWLVKDERMGTAKFNAYALPSLAFGGGYRGCFGRKLATMEFRIIIVLLVLNFEFRELPEDLGSMGASEKLFRHPQMPFARLRAL